MTDEENKDQAEDLEKKGTEDQQDNDQEDTEDKDTTDWKAEALKHKAIADRLKGKLSKVAPLNRDKEEHKVDEELIKDVQDLKEEKLKRQFGFDNGLSPEETDIAFKYSNGKLSKEMLEDSFFKAGLESLRAKKRLESNLPGSNSRSSVFREKSFSETPEEDRKKIFESRIKELKGS